MMSVWGKTAICFLAALMLCAGGKAAAPDASANPYQGIVDRNVFALKPPPAPVRPEDNKPPPPSIKLTGITTILGNKRVLMNVQMPAKPPEPAKSQSFILTEGQRDGEIEVLEIDENTGTVKVNNFGTEMTLTMDKDSVKLPPSVPAAVPLPGTAPPNAVGYVPQPAPVANPLASANGSGGLKTIPTRQLRAPQAGIPQPGAITPGYGTTPARSSATPQRNPNLPPLPQ